MTHKIIYAVAIALVVVPVVVALGIFSKTQSALKPLNSEIDSVRALIQPANISTAGERRAPVICPDFKDLNLTEVKTALKIFLAEYFALNTEDLIAAYDEKEALQTFQKENGLTVTGRLNNQTKLAILDFCKPPIIKSVEPAESGVDSEITILGMGFSGYSLKLPKVQIVFGNIVFEAEPAANGAEIKFKVPAQVRRCPFSDAVLSLESNGFSGWFCENLSYVADIKPGDYEISVKIGNMTSNRANFEVLAEQSPAENIITLASEDCPSITSESECLANTRNFCGYAGGKCDYLSCASLIEQLGKNNPETYLTGCFGDKVPDKTWNYAGRTSDCGSTELTASITPQSGCFWKEK